MASKTHVYERVEDRKVFASSPEAVPHVVALCGEAKAKSGGYHRDYFFPIEVTALESITCPKCSAARALQILAQTPDHGLTTAKFVAGGEAGSRQPYRSAYELRRNGDLIALIVYDGGWRGGSWKVTTLTVREPGRVEMGFEMERRVPRTPTERNPDPYTTQMPRLASKEAAMVFALELLGEKRLLTAAQTIAEEQAFRQRMAEGAARRAAEEAEEERVRAETVEGLREIIAAAEAGALPLTNFQKSAVENALLLGFKVPSR